MRAFARELGALYALHGVNLIVPLVLVPYLTRALGAQSFGVVAFGQAFVGCFLIVVDWGFAYAATREVARARGDRDALARIASEVWAAKLLLLAACFLVLVAAVLAIPALRANATLHLLLYGTVAGPALLPLWLFRGLEKTSIAAAVNAGARLGGLALTVALVRGPDDAPLFAGVLAIQGLGAGIAGILLARSFLGHMPRPPRRAEVRSLLARTWPLFLSSLASSGTTIANPFLLGLFARSAEVGVYSGAERVMFGAISLLTPIAQAAFPRASHLAATDRAAALKVSGQMLALTFALAAALGLVMALAAGPIARFYLGPEFAGAAPVLRVLAFVVPALALAGVLGGQIMVAFGLDARYRSIMGMTLAVHVAAAFALAPALGAVGMAAAFCLSSIVTVVLLARSLGRSGLLPGTAA